MKALPKIRSRRMLSGGTFLKKRQPSVSIASNDPPTPEVNQLAVHRWSYGTERWSRRKLQAATRGFYAETVAMLRRPRAQRSAGISKVRRDEGSLGRPMRLAIARPGGSDSVLS